MNWQTIGNVFDRALALSDEERESFLVRECGADAALLAQVRELLAAHQEPGGIARLAARIAPDVNAALPDAQIPDPGEQIGPYRVMARLGSGGMGVVYLAAREGEGFHQRVAIKVLHSPMLADARRLTQRFLSERSILARLEHPNIPRFLDGGLTRDGAPYIAMEYVEGTPINRYSDERNLTVRQRLSLFAAVCDAMQYAHQHLVVHRDLKPSNILVTSAGVPKVLDFGIAKILDVTDVGATSETDAGQRWMTPDYASPEQVRGEPVTTAADVFALGVLMYEMITCARPHEGRSRHELERAILERDPVKPSVALSGDKCVARGFSPAKLRRELAGDLDTIALKALSKSIDRRYRTAGELGDDIRRYLAGFPVHARGDTLWYRAGKYMKRHRMGVAALAFAVVSLVLGFLGTAVAWHREQRFARQAAMERDRAEQVSRFAVGLFAASDPQQSGAPDVSAAVLLDNGAARLRRELANQPEQKASMLEVLAQSYKGLGRFEDAHAAATEAVLLRRGTAEENPTELAKALELLAGVYIDLQRPDSAVVASREALRIRRATGSRGEPMARSLELLGMYFHMTGPQDSAEFYLRSSIAEFESGNDSARADQLAMLAMVEANRGRWASAESLQLETYRILSEQYPNGHPQVANILGALTFTHASMRRYKDARADARRMLAMYERTIGPKHFDVANGMAVMANLALADNDPDSAVTWATRSLALKREILEPGHVSVGRSLLLLGRAQLRKGNLVAADTILSQALASKRAVLGDQHPEVADIQLDLAAVRIGQRRFTAAKQLIDRARATYGTDSRRAPRIAKADSLLALMPR